MKTPLQGKRFYCREWVFSKLAHYMDSGRYNSGATKSIPGCLIVGGAGSGKTAVCTEIVRPSIVISRQSEINARLLAYHFCHTHLSETCSASAFVLSLVEQLSQSPLLSEYRERLNDDPKLRSWLNPTTCDRYPLETFKKTILEPLLNLHDPPQETLCIIVDSLHESCSSSVDDARCSGTTGVMDLLSQVYRSFPRWLFLICTTRRQCKFVSKSFYDLRRIQLDDLRRSCVVRDVQQYILRRLDEDENLRTQLNLETAEMLNQLHIKSNGCVLYLELVLDGVVDNFLGMAEIKHIPSTLNGLYLWLCQRLFCKKKFSRIQTILNVLLALNRRTLTYFELYQCLWTSDSSLSYDEFVDLLQRLNRLLIIDEHGRCTLFHNSFAEWLSDVKYSTQKYLCDKLAGHAYLAMWYSCRASELNETEIIDFAYHLSKIGCSSTSTLTTMGVGGCGFNSSTTTNNNSNSTTLTPTSSSNNSSSKPSSSSSMSTTFFDGTHLALWLVQCGADVNNLVLKNFAVDESTTRLLVEAGADFVSLDFQGFARSANIDDVELLPQEEELEELSKNPDHDLAFVDDTSVDQEGRTSLHRYAADGRFDAVQLLLNNGSFCDVEDSDGNTPLLLAARQGHADICELLLDSGSDANRVNVAGWTPLRSASWGGHLKVVEILLKYDVVVDCSSLDGRTALRAAGWGGHEECVVALLAAGADPNKADVEGRTPLIAAAYMGHKEIVEILLNAGADVNHKDKDGRTALSVTCMCSSVAIDHTNVARLLLERGADVQCQDNNGKTPLLCAASDGRYELCRLLLAFNADVDHSDGHQCTPLLSAASMGHGSIIDLLLTNGAGLDMIDAEGRTVLTVAAAYGSLEVVKMLLEKGLDEMHKDNHSWIPLHHAAFEGQSDVCRLLAQYNPKTVHVVDHDGRHPLILAVEEGHLEATRTLLDLGANLNKPSLDGRTVLRIACVEGNKDIAHMLISRGADVNHKDLDATPTIYALIYERQLEMAEFLLSYGTDVDNRDVNVRTSLHVACWHGDAQAVELLIKYGADVNALDADKRTPLMVAVWRGHTQIAKLLLQHRADVNAECAEGATALSIAAQEGREDMIKLLLQYHACNDHMDSYGRTPAVVAMKAGHEKISNMLHDYHDVVGTLPGPCSDATNTALSGGSNNSSSDTKTSGFMSLSQALCSSLESPFGTMAVAQQTSDKCNGVGATKNNCNTHSSTRSGHLTGTSSTLSSSCGSPDDDFSRRLLEKSLPRNNPCRPQSMVLSGKQAVAVEPVLSIADEQKLNDLASAIRDAVAADHRNDRRLNFNSKTDEKIQFSADACLQFLNECIMASPAPANQKQRREEVDLTSSSNVMNGHYSTDDDRTSYCRTESTPLNDVQFADNVSETSSMARRRNQIVTNPNIRQVEISTAKTKTRQKPTPTARHLKNSNSTNCNNLAKKETQL